MFPYHRTFPLLLIEIKKIPIGDGNVFGKTNGNGNIAYRNKKDPHRGRKLLRNSLPCYLVKRNRNKKDPHRGRKLTRSSYLSYTPSFIEIKKIPIGDGNDISVGVYKHTKHYRNKKDPHRGRKLIWVISFTTRKVTR